MLQIDPKTLMLLSMKILNFNTDYIISGAWRKMSIDKFAEDYDPKDYEIGEE